MNFAKFFKIAILKSTFGLMPLCNVFVFIRITDAASYGIVLFDVQQTKIKQIYYKYNADPHLECSEGRVQILEKGHTNIKRKRNKYNSYR